MTAHINDSNCAARGAGLRYALAGYLRQWCAARRRRAAQRARRAAFDAIKDHDAWIYRDIGISQADVEWASHQPLHVDAGRELERLRARNSLGR